jgi:hypothetical protein
LNARPHRHRPRKQPVGDGEPRERRARPSPAKPPSRSSELAVTLWVFACLLAVWLLYSWMFERIFSN